MCIYIYMIYCVSRISILNYIASVSLQYAYMVIQTNDALVWILIPFPAQPDKLITTCTEAKIWLASPEFFDSALDFTPIQLTALSTL